MQQLQNILVLFMILTSSLWSDSISIGDEVSMVADRVNVRSCASLSCTSNGRVSIYSKGTVLDGPIDANGYHWWKVDWESGQPDGWTPTPASGSAWYYEKPTILSPGGKNKNYETIQDKSPTLRWKKVDGVVKYRIALRDVDTNELLVDLDIDGSLTSYTYAYTLEENHRYYWNIVPRDKDGDMGIWADSLYFKIAKNDVKKPDLQVESQYIEIRPSSGIEAGNEFSVKLKRIYNRGDARSDRYGIRFYYGGTSNSDSAFKRFDGDSYFQALDPGDYGKIVYSKEINTYSVGGTHYVKVCVYDNPNDSNHDNDCVIKSFEVKPGGNANNDKPVLYSITPNSIKSSYAERIITLKGKNLSNAILKYSPNDKGVYYDVEQSNIIEHTDNTIKIKTMLFSFKIDGKIYGDKIKYKVIKNNQESNIETLNVIYVNLAPTVSLKSGKLIYVNSGNSFTIKVVYVDLDDVFNKKESTLYIDWGDGSKETTSGSGEVQLSHSYTSTYNTTKTITLYAKDSNGNRSNSIQIKVNVKGSSDSTDIKKQVFANSHHDKVAKQSLCNQANNSVDRSIDRATGAENFTITPMVEHGLFDLPLTLKYNSILLDGSSLGKGWSHNYNVSSYIEILEDSYHGKVRVYWDNSNKKFNDFIFDKEKEDDRIYKSTELATKDDILIRREDDSFELKRKDGTIYLYDNTKYLASIKNKKNQFVNVTFDEAGKLIKVEEPVSGQFLQYFYDKNGQLVRVRDRFDRITYFKYNENGLLREVEAPDGIIRYVFHYTKNDQLYKYELFDIYRNKIQYFDITYDTNGKASIEEDGNGNISQFFYNTTKESGKIHSTYINKAGKTTKTVYDATDFRPYDITYPDGTTEHYEYYSDGRKKSFTNRAGYKTNYYYDPRGNLVKVHYSDGSEELYEYDDNRNITQKTIKDKNGKSYVTVNTYDSNNNLTSQTIKNSVGQDLVTTYTYNSNNQMLTKTIDGKTVIYTYNSKGYLISVKTAEGLTTTYTYDGAGRLKTKTTPQSGTTTYEYDVMDNIIAITNQAGKTKTFKYDFRGNKIEEKDFNENITKYTYDDNGNMILKIDALNNEWKFEYDSADRLYKAYDPIHKDKFVKYEYDSMGRLYKKTDKKGYTTTYTYDAMGNLKTQTDPYGHTLFTRKYDSHNNLIESIDILNQTTKTDYTVFGKPSRIVDPLRRVTQFQYDDIGRLIKVINAKGKAVTQSYNGDGTRKAFTDAGGSTTSFTYDDDGKLLTTTTASGSTMTNNYNAKGLLDTLKNGRGDLKHFTYDSLGRVKEAKDKDGTITYTYDDNSNLRTITENGKTATYTYDALNQVKSYTNINGETIYYDYDALGNLVRLTYPNGKVIEYSYDLNSNLKEVKDANQITTYEYDKNNRLVKLTRPNGTVLQRTYNDAGQLTSQTDKTKNGTIISSVTFEYDEVGNIKSETRTPEVIPSKSINLTMTYQKGNLLKEANNTIGYFDKDDNLITLGSKTYTYDSRNRLTNFGNTSYTYDAQNHRVAQTTNGKTTTYTINPNAPLSQTLIIDDAGAKTTYVYGNGLLYQEKDGKKLYYHYDLRGSTIALTDENGNIVDRYSYLPYGELNAHDFGDTKTPFLYNGRDGVMSDDSGLYYMRARYYDPTIKRFINRDTLLGELGDMASLNRFGYVNGNPVSGVDPSGNLKFNISGSDIMDWMMQLGDFLSSKGTKFSGWNNQNFPKNFIRKYKQKIHTFINKNINKKAKEVAKIFKEASQNKAVKVFNKINRAFTYAEVFKGSMDTTDVMDAYFKNEVNDLLSFYVGVARGMCAQLSNGSRFIFIETNPYWCYPKEFEEKMKKKLQKSSITDPCNEGFEVDMVYPNPNGRIWG